MIAHFTKRTLLQTGSLLTCRWLAPDDLTIIFVAFFKDFTRGDDLAAAQHVKARLMPESAFQRHPNHGAYHRTGFRDERFGVGSFQHQAMIGGEFIQRHWDDVCPTLGFQNFSLITD